MCASCVEIWALNSQYSPFYSDFTVWCYSPDIQGYLVPRLEFGYASIRPLMISTRGFDSTKVIQQQNLAAKFVRTPVDGHQAGKQLISPPELIQILN